MQDSGGIVLPKSEERNRISLPGSDKQRTRPHYSNANVIL